jgi:metallo-beta-lactamase family protein
MKIAFHGADQGVTGSCHLVSCAGKQLLIDCGLYQGGRELEEENREPFGFDPKQVDFVLLTHAHLDHCGRLPLLSKRGFRGEIITMAATRELTRIVMVDAAHLQEEEAQHREHRSVHHGKHQHAVTPLYSISDAFLTMDLFGRVTSYGKPLQIAPGIRATFFDAGHILGSASIFLELEEDGRQCSVLFSGDIGNSGRPLLRNPMTPQKADIVVMETTYGDRLHKPLKPSVEEFYQTITGTFSRGGNVVIPTFALERAQELLYFLREGIDENRLSRSTQVFLDSPMAISATEIFERHPECYDPETAELFREGRDPFHLPGLHFTRETAESISINSTVGGAVIMAGSGMCTGGRIRHHLQQNIGRKECSVLFVGYAARGTLARQVIDGAKEVSIYGEKIPVSAEIHTINGFSAHADQAELLAWHKQLGNPKRTFLVHGEEKAIRQFEKLLKDTEIVIPAMHDIFTI